MYRLVLWFRYRFSIYDMPDLFLPKDKIKLCSFSLKMGYNISVGKNANKYRYIFVFIFTYLYIYALPNYILCNLFFIHICKKKIHLCCKSKSIIWNSVQYQNARMSLIKKSALIFKQKICYGSIYLKFKNART